MAADAAIVTNLDGSSIHEGDPGAWTATAQQVDRQRHKRSAHQAHKPSVAHQVGELALQVFTDILVVIGFEGAIVRLMKMNNDGHDLTQRKAGFPFALG